MWRYLGLVGMAIVGVCACISEERVLAKDIRFIAQEPAPDRAIWAPSAVVIDQKNDLKEPLNFILENPTGTDHDFAVHGLYEIVPEHITGAFKSDYFTGPKTINVLRPIHVIVKAKTTLKIAVANEGLLGDTHLGAKYRFFCPTHKDAHLGGAIFVD
jgi:hypothetical protein